MRLNILCCNIHIPWLRPPPAHRRDHLHAAAVSGGRADRGSANVQRGHGASLPEDVRHHRQDSRCRGPGWTGAGKAVHGPGITYRSYFDVQLIQGNFSWVEDVTSLLYLFFFFQVITEEAVKSSPNGLQLMYSRLLEFVPHHCRLLREVTGGAISRYS